MSANLFLKSLKEIRISWPSYAIGMVLYVWMIVAIQPSLAESAEQIDEFIRNYPPELLELFGANIETFATPEGFLAAELFALIWFIIIGAFAISYGTGVLGKEFDNGTIEILLGQPVTRTATVVSKSLVLFLSTAGLVILTILALYVFGRIYDLDLATGGIVALGAVGTLFFLAIASIALFLSVLLGERGRAALLTSAVVVAMYLLTTLGRNATWAERIDVISLYHYYDANELLVSGNIPLDSVLVYAGTTLAFFIGAIVVFNRRNIAP